jgi:hypothetical protein
VIQHRHCEKSGRDPAEIRISAQALVSFKETSALDEGMRWRFVTGPPEALVEVMGAYAEAGVDEFIVPDFNLGTGAQRQEVVDRFFEQVALPFINA